MPGVGGLGGLAAGLALALACATPRSEIFEAVGAHDHDLTRELVGSRADLGIRNDGGMTPLLWAVAVDNLEGARILLEAGADPNATQFEGLGEGRSAIFLALDRPMFELLLAHGAEVDLRAKHGRTALWWNALLCNVEPARILIEAGADVEARDDFGVTPLTAALANKDGRPVEQVDAMARLLKDAGAR